MGGVDPVGDPIVPVSVPLSEVEDVQLAPRAQNPVNLVQRPLLLDMGQVVEHEARDHAIDGFVGEGQAEGESPGEEELHIGSPCLSRRDREGPAVGVEPRHPRTGLGLGDHQSQGRRCTAEVQDRVVWFDPRLFDQAPLDAARAQNPAEHIV